jgi:hypothetical protein
MVGAAARPGRGATSEPDASGGALGWPATTLRVVEAASPLTPPRPTREPQDSPPPQAAVPTVARVVSLRRGRALRLTTPA